MAAYPGKWGASLRATVDHEVSEAVATRLGLQKVDLYNLTVSDAGPGGSTERERHEAPAVLFMAPV